MAIFRPRDDKTEQVNKLTNAVADAMSEQDRSNPYQVPALVNTRQQLSTFQLLGLSIIAPLIACLFGLYESWSPILFAGVILLGTPLTLVALILDNGKMNLESEARFMGRSRLTEPESTE